MLIEPGQQAINVIAEDVALLRAARPVEPFARRGPLAEPLDVRTEKRTALKDHLEAVVIGGIVAASYLNAAIPSSVYYIHALAVKESQRGKGIGAKLLQHAIDKAKQAGLRALHLDVLSDNPAVVFYRSLGFDCLVETTAPVPLQHGVPMEMRMAIDFRK